MEGRIEDTFYKDLKREWRSGSIAVMTDSFKNLPFVVSTKRLCYTLFYKNVVLPGQAELFVFFCRFQAENILRIFLD